MSWLLRLFARQAPEPAPAAPAYDPAYEETRRAQLDILARVRRLGYDIDLASRRPLHPREDDHAVVTHR